MNTLAQNQIQEMILVTADPHGAAATKHCTTCQTELPVSNNTNFTSFGLNLCEYCLYS